MRGPPAAATVGGMTASPMLIERLLPAFDAVRTEHLVVPGDVEGAYAAVGRADFMRAWRDSPAVRALFGTRSLVERVMSAARGHALDEPPTPASMRLSGMPERGEWVVLGEDPPHEIAFGAIGRFWGGETAWDQIDAEAFTTFDKPGYARIACNFSVHAYGAEHSLVSYECRTHATDDTARRAFLRYWRPLSPFIGVVLRAQLGVVAAEATGALADAAVIPTGERGTRAGARLSSGRR
jgi:hypothetical protein